MASKYGCNDTVVGYITNVSNENKKKKYFVKLAIYKSRETPRLF